MNCCWPNTLLNWLKIPEFQGAYREARLAAFSQSIARLQQGATAAAATMLKLMVDASAPPSVRVQAAECVMNHASKVIELEDIEARVAELERAAEAARRSERRIRRLEDQMRRSRASAFD